MEAFVSHIPSATARSIARQSRLVLLGVISDNCTRSVKKAMGRGIDKREERGQDSPIMI
jgi:hypothetical protein